MSIGSIVVTAEVWQEDRSKCVTGVGETIDGGDTAGGNDDKDDVDVAGVAPLTPLVPSCRVHSKGAETPAFGNEVTWLVMDLCPKRLR